ncbi:heterodimeric geranylgeranyl pyrophosphate synthase small subunit, chloroplastic-like [Vicia villosa]|uniref:heterodimeric geranylgeranyl pyrophosphate synthase small subunit, chloroplastic-like n=1 Tax=Vicia villosa TaxID=3911 RepID=UPI00273B4876|nr:heterodimeric geranylgeranyl pyrophosphate synthase small subunit, chloroplastic-like [Vicia villosa]
MATITSHLPNVKSILSNQHRSHLQLKPTTVRMTMTTQQTRNPHLHWASLQADIQAHLKSSITIKQPLEVFEPMHHLIFSAPKTTVPALCLVACELVGGQRHQAISAASALLLMEAATYVHEHLPEPKPKRKPKPVVNHVYGPNVELLTGDGIVPFGFELLARSDGGENSERILRVMVEISRAVGSRGVIDAQYRKTMDTRSDGEEICHVEEIRRMVEKYEGGLHSCGAVCGGVLGGGSEEEIERLRKFGFYVGMIQGMAQRGFNESKEVDEARNLALQELKFFKDKEVDTIKVLLNI